MIAFRVLGTLDLQDPDNGDLGAILARPKLVALLTYLVLARPNGFRSRETLLALFWPESSQTRARGALNQALYELRKGLGEGVLVSRGDGQVGLDRARIRSDVETFEAALAAGDRAEALCLYGGELLPGFALPECPEFEEWLDERRRGLREVALSTAKAWAGELSAREESTEAVYWLRRALRWEPYDEDVFERLLVELLAMADRTGALREYGAFAERLREDLGVEPRPEIEALAERARQNHLRELREAGGLGMERPVIEGSERAALEGAALSVPAAPSRRWGRTAAALSAFAILATVGGVVWLRGSGPPAPGETPIVLVATFENRSGDPSLDDLGGMARDWITQELVRTGLVRVVPASDALRPGREGVDPMELARRVGAGVLVAGSYHERGDSIVARATLRDVETGEVLRVVEATGEAAAGFDVLERLRQRTTGALASAVDPRLVSWSRAASPPPTYAAYRALSRGIEQFARRDYRGAASSFREAGLEDPSFLTPAVWEVNALYGAMWENSREIDFATGERADSLLRDLAARRDELSPWDLSMVDYTVAEEDGDMRASRDALRRMMALAPEDRWRVELARVELWENRPRAARALLEDVDTTTLTDSERGLYHYGKVHAHHRLEEYDAELSEARAWRKESPGSPMPYIYEIRALAGLGRREEIATLLAEFVEVRPGYHMFVYRELEIHGLGDLAREQMTRDLAWVGSVPEADRDDLWAHDEARLLYLTGQYEAARRVEERRLATMPFTDNVVWTMGLLGRIAARRGERDEALRYDRMLVETDWTPVWYANLALWIARERAQIAVLLGERDRAVGLLEEAYRSGGIYGDAHLESMSPDLDGLRDHPAYRRLGAVRG